MAKTKQTSAANPEIDSSAPVADNEAMVLSPTEGLTIAEVIASKGLDANDWEVQVAGGTAYWLSEPGAWLVGKVLNNYKIVTSKIVNGSALIATMHAIQCLQPTKAINAEGEEITLEPGEVIAVLERHLLKCLNDDIGCEVAIICDGKGKTKGDNDIWKYRVLKRKASAKPLETIRSAGQLSS